jgi:peroxiredoxin
MGWGAGVYLGYRLLVDRGWLLLRIETLEEQLAQLSAIPSMQQVRNNGLPIGVPAPDFELPDLSGARMALDHWRGRRILLIFFNPDCCFCRAMLPDLAGITENAASGRPTPLLVTTGDAADNRRLMDEHGVGCPVLLQDEREVADLFHVPGTPTAYMIDEHGVIASPRAMGAQQILALLATTPAAATSEPDDDTAHTVESQRAVTRRIRSVADSRLNRQGLTAGTVAPLFSLPRLDGGKLSLQEYRGRRVLLVFSDPACAPCNQLAGELERLHRRASDLTMLMISRGDVPTNQAHVAEHNLTFPIVLQRHWEISREYAMFATPIGYLIDEQGVLASSVAVGAEAILALASRPTAGQPIESREVLMPV